LEEGRGSYQPGEKLEEDGSMPTGEMAVAELSGEGDEHQLNGKTAKLESAIEWLLSARKGDKNNMGYRIDLPTHKEEEMQPRRLHEESQPLEQLDKVLENIRRLMLRSTQEEVNEEKLTRG
jgi:hypothetical protein